MQRVWRVILMSLVALLSFFYAVVFLTPCKGTALPSAETGKICARVQDVVYIISIDNRGIDVGVSTPS